MSWGMYAVGSKAGVRKKIEEATLNGQEQGELARELILKVIEAVPTNGVQVEASGHHDQVNASLSVKVVGMVLALDEPAQPAEPVDATPELEAAAVEAPGDAEATTS